MSANTLQRIRRRFNSISHLGYTIRRLTFSIKRLAVIKFFLLAKPQLQCQLLLESSSHYVLQQVYINYVIGFVCLGNRCALRSADCFLFSCCSLLSGPTRIFTLQALLKCSDNALDNCFHRVFFLLHRPQLAAVALYAIYNAFPTASLVLECFFSSNASTIPYATNETLYCSLL